eukprot:9131811-Pyramimonas_sp.AAC.1
MFPVCSGIIQGCPASGALFAAYLKHFLLDFQISFATQKHGIILACADDIVGVIRKLRIIKILYRVFSWAHKVAELVLKTSICFITPLAGPWEEELATRCAAKVAEIVPPRTSNTSASGFTPIPIGNLGLEPWIVGEV